jgi:penicillin-binding protein A
VNAPIRRVGTAMLLLFVALVGQLTYLQLIRADDLKNDPGNSRVFVRDYERARGAILSSDGAILAESVETPQDDKKQLRVYPPETAQLFAHVVGYQSFNLGNQGVEAEYNDELVGRDIDVSLDNLSDILSGKDTRGHVVLTTSKRAQEVAAVALGGKRGSVVVLDVRSGAIVAAYSNPTFDPNVLATHDDAAASDAFSFLAAHPDNPMLPRAWREIYPPGSTFKVVTAGLALGKGIATLDREFPRLKELELPLTDNTLENFGGNTCGGSLVESFRDSCNTTFGQLGLDLAEQLAEGVEDWGINVAPPNTDLRPDVVRSVGPKPGTFKSEAPTFAQAAIGQTSVAVTPIEMAMIVQAIANEGTMMVPHVLDHVENTDGEDIPGTRYTPRTYKQSTTPEVANQVRDMMVEVVNNGSGTRAQIPGIQVAGKTGTAQVEGNEKPHAWFVAFAPAEQPVYAISVLVENGGDMGSEATGGRVAAPIARDVLAALLVPNS